MTRPFPRFDRIAHLARAAVALVRLRLRDGLAMEVGVEHGSARYRFSCGSFTEYLRATSLTTKEPGTVAWLASDIRPGDVVYDIGANVGIYTVVAAANVGQGGHVYAFEPHVANVASLLRNVSLNGVDGRVSVVSAALHDRDALTEFRYSDLTPGAALSEVAAAQDGPAADAPTVAVELKAAATVDRLVADGAIRPPDLVKLDVDGNELLVLRGMERTLRQSAARALQVEINADHDQQLSAFLRERGFEPAERHFSGPAQRLIDRGQDPASLGVNVIFRRRLAAH